MFGRLLLILFLLLVITFGTLAVLIVDSTPQIQRTSSQQVDNADTVHKLLSQLKNSLDDRHAANQVEISEAQFDSLMGFAQRAVPGFQGAVTVENSQTLLAASVELPAPLNENFINISAQVLPGEGVDIDYVQIGSLVIPGDTALHSAVWIVDLLTQSDVASTAATQITQITMNEKQLTLDMRPLNELLEQIEVVRENMDEEVDELGMLTSDYLAFLNRSPISLSPSPKSLAGYINLVLSRAHDDSDSSNAVLHNQAALLALAIFLGDHRITSLAGAEQPEAGEVAEPKAPVVLAQRNDLAKHFVISAALQILSQQQVTMAIGEFKELMDRAMGGSGYSFVDLAADMSGIAFAQVASEPQSAAELQRLAVKSLRERDILPYIGGLPEGLSKKEFRHRYSEVDSPAYRKQVAEIQARIDKLPLYQS